MKPSTRRRSRGLASSAKEGRGEMNATGRRGRGANGQEATCGMWSKKEQGSCSITKIRMAACERKVDVSRGSGR